MRPDTILRWHPRPAHPPPRHRLPTPPPRTTTHAALNPHPGPTTGPRDCNWGYRRIHGELLTLGIKVAASTVWAILHEAGIDPAPDRSATTWAAFLRCQAQALLAADFIETITLGGTRLYILAVIEHATRRIRILGATAHPTAAWVTQTARNLVLDLHDAGSTARYLIRDRDGEYPMLFDAILADNGITVVRSGVQMPRWRRCPGRSATRTNSPSFASAAETASAASYTSTNIPLDQPGRNSRQVQGQGHARQRVHRVEAFPDLGELPALSGNVDLPVGADKAAGRLH
jgi:hypothetical protein